MDDRKFLDQKASEMTIRELLKAVLIKAKQKDNKIEVGDYVEIVQEYPSENQGEYNGKKGKVIGIVPEHTFPYDVMLDDCRNTTTRCHKVKIVKQESKKHKTRITFKQVTKTRVEILLDGKVIGDIWSELESGTLPYTNNNSNNTDMIQLCGFMDSTPTGGCGRFTGRYDLTAKFEGKEVKRCERCGQRTD